MMRMHDVGHFTMDDASAKHADAAIYSLNGDIRTIAPLFRRLAVCPIDRATCFSRAARGVLVSNSSFMS